MIEFFIVAVVGFILGRKSKPMDEKSPFINEALLRARQMHCPNCKGKAFLEHVPRGEARRERLRILLGDMD